MKRLLALLLLCLPGAGHAATIWADSTGTLYPELSVAPASGDAFLIRDVSVTSPGGVKNILWSTIAAQFAPADAETTALAGLTSAADRLPYFTGSGTASLATFTAAGRSLLDDADASAQRTTLGLTIGTNVQAYDADLTTYAGITPQAFMQTFIGSANVTTAQDNLNLGALALLDSLADGSVGVAKLSATGTASASTYLRGDNTWATVSGTGDVTAASSFSTDNRLIRSDGTGKGVQATGITVDDSDNVTGVTTLTATTTNATTLAIGGTTVTATGTELNILDGVTATAAELNYVDGVTSAIQTQIDGKISASSTDTLTNKALDASATGNVVKMKGYVYLTFPHYVDGTGATLTTTATSQNYGHATFSNSADQAANYVEYQFTVPEDYDATVTPRAKLKFVLSATANATQRFVLSMVSVADSAVPSSATLANAINLDFAGDASGATGDVESVGYTSLTGWAPTAGQVWRIRLARDGDATEDASTNNSTERGLVIEYGISQ